MLDDLSRDSNAKFSTCILTPEMNRFQELGVEVTKVAGVDNGDELAAFDPESWLKVRAVIRVYFAPDVALVSTKSRADFLR